MNIWIAVKYTVSNLRIALSLSLISVTFVIAAEGVQHLVEWYLGMYQSREMFTEHQSNPIRLGFGIFKAISLFTACYFIPKNLSETYGPPHRHGSFNKDIVRKLWDPRSGMSGPFAMFILCVPIIVIHYKLGGLAMGHTFAWLLLVLDSILVGFLALIMGVSIWAGDITEYEKDPSAWIPP